MTDPYQRNDPHFPHGGYNPRPETESDRRLKTAGSVALWVWVALALVPVIAIIGCIVLCMAGIVTAPFVDSPEPTFVDPTSNP